MSLMGIGTFFIGVLPSYASAGIIAPVIRPAPIRPASNLHRSATTRKRHPCGGHEAQQRTKARSVGQPANRCLAQALGVVLVFMAAIGVSAPGRIFPAPARS